MGLAPPSGCLAQGPWPNRPDSCEEEKPLPHLLIIGGSDAGISAALRARELDRSVEITLVYADEYPNFSVCGLPYYLGGEINDFQSLAHRTAAEIAAHDLKLLPSHRAVGLDPKARTVTLRDPAGRSRSLPYDRLVLGTGSRPRHPAWPVPDHPGVHFLHSPEDGLKLGHFLEQTEPRRAAILGGGYIALEVAEALLRRGWSVDLILRGTTPLGSTDPELGDLLAGRLRAAGVRILTGFTIRELRPSGRQLVIRGAGVDLNVDLVLFAIGAVLSIFTGKSFWRSGTRMLLVGSGVAALTHLLGRLAGVAVG